jgi:hypothetical protein
MVFKKGMKVGRAKTGTTASEWNWAFSNAHRKKNQLVQAISPYDELPVMQDLAGQLVPPTNPSEHRESDRKKQTDAVEERQPSVVVNVSNIEPYHFLSSYNNGAHYVPSTIEIPSKPAQSEDSELTLNNAWKGQDDSDDRGPRSLTPHPSFEEVEPTTVDFQYLYEAGLKADSDLWPSDEDTVSKTKVQAKSETQLWPNGSIHIWHLDGGGDGAKEDAISNRRQKLPKKRFKKGRTFAMI